MSDFKVGDKVLVEGIIESIEEQNFNRGKSYGVYIDDNECVYVDDSFLSPAEEKEMSFKLLGGLIGVKMESLKDSIKEIVESGKKEELLSEAIQFEEFYGNLLWKRAEIDILIEKNRRKHIKAGIVALTLRFMEQKHD